MLQILCKTPAAIFKIQIPANTKSKFNRPQHQSLGWQYGISWVLEALPYTGIQFPCPSMAPCTASLLTLPAFVFIS